MILWRLRLLLRLRSGCEYGILIDVERLMMIQKFEISKNPNILIDNNFDYKLITLENIKLDDSYENINILDVVDVYVENYSEQYANFQQQISQFTHANGWIHMSGKFTFGIKNSKIDTINLKGKYIENLTKFKEKHIISVYGEPDKILVDADDWGIDYVEHAKILVYTDKKLYFFIDSDSKKLKEIHIGNINEKFFSSRTI